jgi:hypothetical protein
MNDIVDLTDTFSDLVENYTGEFGAIVDLDAWATEDLTAIAEIIERVLEERAYEQRQIRDAD